MHKPKILLIVVIFLSTTGITQAEDNKLGVTFDFDYMSKWMTKGKEGYSENGVCFETINLDFWDTGFGVSVKHLSPTGSGFYAGDDVKDKQRLDYSVSYKNSLFDDRAYETKHKLSWTYKNYYDLDRNEGNVQAWKLKLSWPELLWKGIQPYYIAH
ncbi:MAG: hypothetical protein JSW47_05390, partial [Phycisphaerales bacterium]